MTVSGHLACFGSSDEIVKELQNDFVAVDKASIASRFVIEYAAARPPKGSRKLSTADYDRVLALASEITYFGTVSDSLKYELSNHSFELLKSGRLSLSDPHFERAMVDFQDAFYARLAKHAVAGRKSVHSAPKDPPDAAAPDDLDELERAARAEFGLPLSQIGEVLAVISASPFTAESGVGRCLHDDLIAYVTAEIPVERCAVLSVIALLTLRERADFLRPPSPYRPVDVYPWRFNRGLSYLRRPFIEERGPSGTELLWGRRALHQAMGYLAGLCTSGRLKDVRSDEMRKYQGRTVDRVGRLFNDRLAKSLEGTGNTVVRKEIKKFNGKRLQRATGDDLGDIDVLVAIPDSRRLVAMEGKCFSLAKTPAELANERDELFGELEKRTGAVARHLERTRWLEDNLIDVLHELRLAATDVESWSVEPLLILDSDLITRRLVGSPFPILVFHELKERLSEGTL